MKHQNGKENRLRYVYSLYGFDEYGFSEIPTKGGNRIYRLVKANGPNVACALCFLCRISLHYGYKNRDLRNWKKFRKHQWKEENLEHYEDEMTL